MGEPYVVRRPATGVTSLIPTGRPHKGPGGSPRARRTSRSRASSRARSLMVTIALSRSLWRTTRSRQASTTATAEICRAATSRRISIAARSGRSAEITGSLRLPFPRERHRPRERGFAALEEPREASDDQPLVLDLGGVDPAAQVLDVNAVLGEERVVGQLIGVVREQALHLLRPELRLGLGADALTVVVHSLPEESPDREVHRV